MIIQHNILAINNLMVGKQLQKGKAKTMERLASGYRINRAADDAANMAISEKMTSRIRALARCQQNVEEGISLAQTADGALNEVNNMLNRVNELCVQAANDTNTAEDRSKIAEEITQIYNEMDRIFETTEFNTMKIFRHDGDNYYGPEAEYLYHESVTSTPGELHSWGSAMFPTKQFDLAKPATAAPATLTFGKNFNPQDSSTLDGTSFHIDYNGKTYTIEFGTAMSTGQTSDNYDYYINTASSSYDTVQEAFNYIVSNYPFYQFIDSVSVNSNSATFTFEMPEDTKNISFKADLDKDGVRELINTTEKLENGAKNNGIPIYCDGNTLDAIGTPNTKITYSDTASVTITPLSYINSGSTDLPQNYNDWTSYVSALSYNELNLFASSADTISLAPLAQKNIQSIDDFRRELTALIDSTTGFSAVFDGNKNITVTKEGLPETSNAYGYIYEQTNPNGSPQSLTAVPVSVTVQSTTPSSEAPTVHKFTLPDFDKTKTYSVIVDGSRYLIYDYREYPNYSVSSYDGNSRYYSAWSGSPMENALISILRSEYSDYNVSYNSTTKEVTMTSKELNNQTAIRVESGATDVTATMTPVSKQILGIGLSYYSREYSLVLDFTSFADSGFDPTSLYGKGFMLNNTYYQFTGAGDNTPKYNKDTLLVSLNSVNDIEELREALENATGHTATDDGSSKITLTDTIYTDSDKVTFSDGGPSGTFTNSAVSSGGTAYKNPQAEIDFSAYDMDNLDDLYGTGFRITCATCPGEFVNVMFCHDKSELTYPDSFEYTDANGNTNTIHNYMVELKDVTAGSQIAAYIAEQLEKDLDHFTEVKVSDTNPAVLIAQDKRSKDQTGRGQVLAGVYTNFLYNVVPEKLPNLGDKVGGGRKDTDAYYAYCMIYAGDTKEKPYIAVHLPHFSVQNLKLEYPGEPWDTYEKITDVMNRSKNAAEVVSMARSKIGADQNRLEHAFDYAANAEEQITDAMSRIKDTDMADAVTTQAKLTILSNTQEAMHSQIVDLPERILPLLQQ